MDVYYRPGPAGTGINLQPPASRRYHPGMPARKSSKGKRRTRSKKKVDPQRRMADRVREEILRADPGAFVCPYCRCALNWQTVGSAETEVSIYVREKILFCPECRSFLGVSSWHPEG